MSEHTHTKITTIDYMIMIDSPRKLISCSFKIYEMLKVAKKAHQKNQGHEKGFCNQITKRHFIFLFLFFSFFILFTFPFII